MKWARKPQMAPDAIERQLTHVESNDVRRAHLRGEHWRERVEMMQDWADYLALLKGQPKVLEPKFGQRMSARTYSGILPYGRKSSICCHMEI